MSEREVTLSDLVAVDLIEIGAGRPRSVDLDRYQLPILRVADVLDGRIESSFRDAPGIFRQEMGTKVSRPGDIVLTAKGTVGRVALMPPKGPLFAYSPQLCYFRPSVNGPLKSRYLYYWFKSADFWDQANALKGQTDMADFLSLGDIYSLKMRLPSHSHQAGVIDVLGALDDKIAVNERIATTADSMCDLIFQSRAQQHTSVPMSQLLQPILGGTPDRKNESYWGGSVPWASAKDVVNATVGVLTSTEEHITEAATQNSRAKTLRPGSVVLTARGTVGAVARMAMPAAINQSCYAFEPGRVPAAVLFHVVRSASKSMLGMAHGTVFSTVNMKTFDHVEIPDLPADVLDPLNGELASLHQLIVSHLRESRQLAILRDTLLPQLMSGRLRVKDAEKIVEDAT